uniref:CSON005099 protein n=1 Tax=Culicoides sonorensis TaxID=179676 RepID=A0A336KBT4_CULSO
MSAQKVNLIINHPNPHEIYVEICARPDLNVISKYKETIQVKNDHKTNDLLKINCRNCSECIELNVYFSTREVKDFEAFEDAEKIQISEINIKAEPEIVIKTEDVEEAKDEEMAMSGDENHGWDDPSMSDDSSDFNSDGDDDDYEAPSTRTKGKKTKKSEKIQEGNSNQRLYRRQWGSNEEIVTNFDLSKHICDICGTKKRECSSYPDFLIHRAAHFFEKKSEKEYHCLGCDSIFEKIDIVRFHTRTCSGRDLIKSKFKAGKLKVKQRAPRPFTIPEGVILPDLNQIKAPFYQCFEQKNGVKIWVEKQKTKQLRISNFDPHSLKCDMCGFDTKQFSVLIRHRNLHLFQQDSDIKCLGCNQEFPDPNDRLTHAYCCLKKDTVDILQCSYCSFRAASYHQLRNHIGGNHGPNKESYYGHNFVICHICSKQVRRSRMHNHLLQHTVSDGRPYICAHCDKRLTSRGALRGHLIKFHFKNFASYTCHLCPMVFKRKEEHDKHLFARHQIGKSVWTVPCKLCGKILANESSLSAHITARHTAASAKQKYECPQCHKIFLKKSNMDNHIPTHLPESERPFKCWCGRGYASRDKLNKHNLEHTNPEKLLSVCSVCGKSMKSKQSLKVHMRIHTGEQPYECNFCSRKFADRGNYRVHMKQHEKEMGLKLTFTAEERRLMKLNVIQPDQVLENPGRSGTEEIAQAKSTYD